METFVKEDRVLPPVSQGPTIVAGEGEYSKNHTLLRVFNQHQVMTAQFLAYPASVRGGVNVTAGQLEDEVLIATSPITDENIREIRIFDQYGSLKNSIKVNDLKPPYLITTGNYLNKEDNEQLAVVSTNFDENNIKVL